MNILRRLGRTGRSLKLGIVIPLMALAMGCGKDNGEPAIVSEDEKLIKTVSTPEAQITYEYHPDKTLKTIISGTNGDRFTFEYHNGNLVTFKTLTTNGFFSMTYTYDKDNRVTSFKKGNAPAVIIEYFDDLNRYVWRENDISYEVHMNAHGDISKTNKSENNRPTDQLTFIYDVSRKGGFYNSKSVLAQAYMFMFDFGFILHHRAGMSVSPLTFFGNDNIGIHLDNAYDQHGFLTKSTFEEDSYIIYEYFGGQ